MSNQDTEIARSYMKAVFERAHTPMEPANYWPDWSDQPLRHKIYNDVVRYPLPDSLPRSLISMNDLLARLQQPSDAAFARGLSLSNLSVVLRLAYGLIQRRLQIHWNPNNEQQIHYHEALFGRATPSGGGLYPAEIYWCCGAGGPMMAGVYHYDTAHHGMQRLYVGDVTAYIREAVRHHPLAQRTNQFLLLSLNFWKNSFKYNSFSYHVVTQDLGNLLCCLRMVSLGFGTDLPFLFWYHDEGLNRLLGLETLAESVFAAVPIPVDDMVPEEPGARALPYDPFSRTSYQRSKRLLRFPMIEAVHEAALIKDERLPTLEEIAELGFDEVTTSGKKVALPDLDASLLQADLIDTLAQRRSSFGRFSAHRPLSLGELATLLQFATRACHYVADVKLADGRPPFTKLMVFANHVQGLERGTYLYDAACHALDVVRQEDVSTFLQSRYFLQNYNLSETAAVIAIAGNPEKMLSLFGNRGYRILNAEVGYLTHSLYMAATAISIGCGAALGFDNIAMDEKLNLEGDGWRTIIYIMVGPERPLQAAFESKLF